MQSMSFCNEPPSKHHIKRCRCNLESIPRFGYELIFQWHTQKIHMKMKNKQFCQFRKQFCSDHKLHKKRIWRFSSRKDGQKKIFIPSLFAKEKYKRGFTFFRRFFNESDGKSKANQSIAIRVIRRVVFTCRLNVYMIECD